MRFRQVSPRKKDFVPTSALQGPQRISTRQLGLPRRETVASSEAPPRMPQVEVEEEDVPPKVEAPPQAAVQILKKLSSTFPECVS